MTWPSGLRRQAAILMGSPAQVRILPSSDSFFLFSLVRFCLHLQVANATHVLSLDTQDSTSGDIYIHFVLIELQCFVANRGCGGNIWLES